MPSRYKSSLVQRLNRTLKNLHNRAALHKKMQRSQVRTAPMPAVVHSRHIPSVVVLPFASQIKKTDLMKQAGNGEAPVDDEHRNKKCWQAQHDRQQ
jgi:hypothetical protein